MTHELPRRTLLGGLAVALSGARAQATDRAGEVESSKGECYAQTDAARRALPPAADIFVGDSVRTGALSALVMHLGTATEVRMGQETQLRIDRFLVNAGGSLELERGSMLFDHNSKAGGTDIRVRSPFGLIAVRGTRFFAGPSNGVFGVFVERGAVTVVGVRTAVLVVSGYGTNIAQPGSEPTPPAAWGAARIASAMASVT